MKTTDFPLNDLSASRIPSSPSCLVQSQVLHLYVLKATRHCDLTLTAEFNHFNAMIETLDGKVGGQLGKKMSFEIRYM